MNKIFYLSFLLIAGCTSINSSKSEKHQMELSFHKLRTDVEEIKHDLNTYEIEHHVLDGKLIDQEQNIIALKKQISQLTSGKLESFLQEIKAIEKKILELSKNQEKIILDIRQLSSHANDTTTALSQSKDKIAQFEKSINLKNQQINELAKLKEGIEKLSQYESIKTYSVRQGDSLEKIAKEYSTTVEELKKLNQMETDLIVIDQILEIP